MSNNLYDPWYYFVIPIIDSAEYSYVNSVGTDYLFFSEYSAESKNYLTENSTRTYSYTSLIISFDRLFKILFLSKNQTQQIIRSYEYSFFNDSSSARQGASANIFTPFQSIENSVSWGRKKVKIWYWHISKLSIWQIKFFFFKSPKIPF